MIAEKICRSLPSTKRKKEKYLKYIKSCYDYNQATPSVICNTCIGGMAFHNLGLKFCSPTINLWIGGKDFFKFITNLKTYLEYDLIFIKTEEKTPVAMLFDIKIHFNHYKTEEEAREKWNARKERIDFDNLYFITDENALNEKNIEELKKLKCKRLLIFSAKEHGDDKTFFTYKKYQKDGLVGLYSTRDYFGFAEFEKSFNYANWLSGKDDLEFSFNMLK